MTYYMLYELFRILIADKYIPFCVSDMARKHTCNRPAGLITDAPPAADLTSMFEAFVRRIEWVGETLDNNHNDNNHNNVLIHQTEDKLLKRFYALRPKQFDGIAE